MSRALHLTQQYLFLSLAIIIPVSSALTNINLLLILLIWMFQGDILSKLKSTFSYKWISSIYILITLYIIGVFVGGYYDYFIWFIKRLWVLLLFPVFFTINLEKTTLKKSVVLFLLTNAVSAILAFFISQDLALSAFLLYNHHNILLSFCYALSLYILYEKKSNKPILICCLILIYSINIFMQGGRAGYMLFVFISMFYIFYYNRKRIINLLGLLISLAFFLITMFNASSVFQERIYQTKSAFFNNDGGLKNAKSINNTRYFFVKESFKRIIKKPLIGHGTGSFKSILEQEMMPQSDTTHHFTPHNNYLFVFFEIGVLGLLVLLSIFYHQIKDLNLMSYSKHRILLPVIFLLLMMVDSYVFIPTVCITYVYLYTIYSKLEVN